MLSKFIKDHKYPHNFNENGLEPTKNRMGGMHTLSKYSAKFIEMSAHAVLPVMDIGCAYGVATIPALEKGANVIAIDIDQEHLDILRERAPPSLLCRLTTVNAEFPDDVSFPPNSVSAVLMSRLFSFLTPEQLQEGLNKVHDWLEPGGAIFAVNHTPYIKLFDYFIDEFEERKANNDPWPGLISSLTSHPKYDYYKMPKWINLMDIEIFERIFTDSGFIINELEYFQAPEITPVHDVQLDGRELIGCIATKARLV